jgi:hypothetical protein
MDGNDGGYAPLDAPANISITESNNENLVCLLQRLHAAIMW